MYTYPIQDIDCFEGFLTVCCCLIESLSSLSTINSLWSKSKLVMNKWLLCYQSCFSMPFILLNYWQPHHISTHLPISALSNHPLKLFLYYYSLSAIPRLNYLKSYSVSIFDFPCFTYLLLPTSVGYSLIVFSQFYQPIELFCVTLERSLLDSSMFARSRNNWGFCWLSIYSVVSL